MNQNLKLVPFPLDNRVLRCLSLGLALSMFAGSSLDSLLAQVTNAPVAPDTIYVARRGAQPGLSIVDLNGFGQGTGDPTFDPTYQTFQEGWSNYVNNPNFKLMGSMLRPPLFAPTSTLDGGSSGVFTLTRNSALQNLLLSSPSIASIGDMMLGQPLDRLMNNGLAPFGCQLGGGDPGSINALQVLEVGLNGLNTIAPVAPGTGTLPVVGAGNPISWAPCPNPPALITPPLCVLPAINAQQPTSIDTITAAGLFNLLGPGDPFGDPTNGQPPTGLLSEEQNSFFIGPSWNQPLIINCQPYSVRQQIGHYLYIADRTAGEIVVANSNNMSVLARIPVADPTELAMSPDLKLLGVTQRSLDHVTFIDIDPTSPTFHQVLSSVSVGVQPVGIAWSPDNEDVMVCNEGSSSVTIISTNGLFVRKVVRRGLDRPFAVAITARQFNFGHFSDVWYAYILDRSGHVTLFESGPNGVNGWGYDDIVGRTPFVFPRAKAIQPDPLRLSSGVWIAHEVKLDLLGNPTGQLGGAVTNLVLDTTTTGVQPLTFMSLQSPNMRGKSFRVERSIGDDQLTGVPSDLAFDDQRNLGALEVVPGQFGSSGVPINSKQQVRSIGGVVHNVNEATYLFLPVRGATPGQEHVDVIRLATGLRIDTNAFHTGVQSISAPGAALVMDYFRQ